MIKLQIKFLLLVAIVFSSDGLAARRAPGSDAKTPETEVEEPSEEIVALHGGQRQQLQGRILVEATAGDVLLQTDDGTLWLLQSDQILSRARTR